MTASDGEINSDSRCLKFINFSINNISIYFGQVRNDKTNKQIIELVKKRIKQMQLQQQQQ